MDIAEFKKEYGKEWEKLIAKPVWTAVMAVADEESPMRQSAERPDGDVVVAGSHLYAQIKGWEGLRRLLNKRLLSGSEEKDLEPDYKTEQKI